MFRNTQVLRSIKKISFPKEFSSSLISPSLVTLVEEERKFAIYDMIPMLLFHVCQFINIMFWSV